jgi:hypothetical protein
VRDKEIEIERERERERITSPLVAGPVPQGRIFVCHRLLAVRSHWVPPAAVRIREENRKGSKDFVLFLCVYATRPAISHSRFPYWPLEGARRAQTQKRERENGGEGTV